MLALIGLILNLNVLFQAHFLRDAISSPHDNHVDAVRSQAQVYKIKTLPERRA